MTRSSLQWSKLHTNRSRIELEGTLSSRYIDPTIRRVSPHSKLLKNVRELIQWLHMQKSFNADGCTGMLAWAGQRAVCMGRQTRGADESSIDRCRDVYQLVGCPLRF